MIRSTFVSLAVVGVVLCAACGSSDDSGSSGNNGNGSANNINLDNGPIATCYKASAGECDTQSESDAAGVMEAEASCTSDNNQVVTKCPSDGVVGCCVVAGLPECVYGSNTTFTEPICTGMLHGTWTTSVPLGCEGASERGPIPVPNRHERLPKRRWRARRTCPTLSARSPSSGS